MTPHEFRNIRLGLMMTQQQLADLLGYAQKIRISEYERNKHPIPIPPHIAALMRELEATGGKHFGGRLIRGWHSRDAGLTSEEILEEDFFAQ